jgi:minimal CRISPR polymerase domain
MGEGCDDMMEWYLAVDGDDIGRRLELCMVTNDIEALSAFASSFDSAVNSMVDYLRGVDGVDVILFGGDSIMMKVRDEMLDLALRAVNETGRDKGFTFSGGYASTMREAYLALKIAKASGKDRIVGPLDGAASD